MSIAPDGTNESGQPGRWIPVCPADAVAAGQIVDAELPSSDDWVVWRTESGKPCVNAARCPHLWSHFAAEGVVDGEVLICLSHGWRFSTTGEGTIQRRTTTEVTTPIPALQCRESDGWIEAWVGPEPTEDR